MKEWHYFKDEKPEAGSIVTIARFHENFPDAWTYYGVAAVAAVGKDKRDMWRYEMRKEDAKDPYGIKNVNFSCIEPTDDRWEEAKQQRLERGFDYSEMWNLDKTIVEFIRPRLHDFRENHGGCPMGLTEEQWNEILDKMLYWFDNYGAKCPYDIRTERKKHDQWFDNYNQKVQEAKELFIKYFSDLWW